MELTLLMQIQQAEKTREELTQRVREYDALIHYLQGLRADCKHEFEPAPKGYEHEGGTCKHCGINEIYAHTLQQQKQIGKMK